MFLCAECNKSFPQKGSLKRDRQESKCCAGEGKEVKSAKLECCICNETFIVEVETFEGTIAKRRVNGFLAPMRDARSLLQGMMVY